MTDILFGPGAIWFGVPAVVGTAFFTLRLVMMLVGGDADGALDGDVDLDSGGADPGDADVAFKVLSVQAISAFLAGFGWGGLGAFRGSGWSGMVSVGVGFVCGLAMLWLLGTLMRFVYGLQSSGNVPIYQALEAEGSVYTTVPAVGEGWGEVRVVIGERERYYKAITAGDAIATGSKVRVVSIDENEESVTVTEI